MKKLRVIMTCSECGETDLSINTDLEINFDGCCPFCGRHHGEVSYEYLGNEEDFISTLASYEPKDIINNAAIIKYCAEELSARR